MDREGQELPFGRDSAADFMRRVFINERRIYAYIYVQIPNRVDADDLFQETVMIMWKKHETYVQGSDFGAWGIGIAYNLVRNYRRKKARSHLQFTENVEQLIESETTKALSNLDYKLDALKKCLHKLKPEDKNIIMLKYEYELSTEEIARKKGNSMNAIYVKLARANDFLLRCIRRSLAEQNINI